MRWVKASTSAGACSTSVVGPLLGFLPSDCRIASGWRCRVGMTEKPRPEPALTHFAGRAGDHNDRAMVGSRFVAQGFARQFGREPVVIGSPEPALPEGWRTELTAAMPALKAMSERYEQIFTGGLVLVTALSRCAVALATLPVVARHRPD